jgi:hypothetical protein
MGEETVVDLEAANAQRADADRDHMADRAPTADEEKAAEKSRAEFADDAPKVAEHYTEMSELGAHVKGEGEID